MNEKAFGEKILFDFGNHLSTCFLRYMRLIFIAFSLINCLVYDNIPNLKFAASSSPKDDYVN